MFVITNNKPRPLALFMQECDCPEGTEDCWHNYQLGFYHRVLLGFNLDNKRLYCDQCWPMDCNCRLSFNNCNHCWAGDCDRCLGIIDEREEE